MGSEIGVGTWFWNLGSVSESAGDSNREKQLVATVAEKANLRGRRQRNRGGYTAGPKGVAEERITISSSWDP